jgi:Rrf2 family transcriptional regulator, iron-sulfur cluster assembly transcription factor
MDLFACILLDTVYQCIFGRKNLFNHMFVFNKKTLLGVDVLTVVGSLPQGALVTTLTLAETLSLSVSHVESIVRLLREAGFLRSVRGPGGGYYIARSPDRINIWEVVSAMEDKEVTECSSGRPHGVTTALEDDLVLEVKSFLTKKTVREIASTESTGHVHPVQVRSGFGVSPKPASLMPIAPNSVFQLSSYLQSALA